MSLFTQNEMMIRNRLMYFLIWEVCALLSTLWASLFSALISTFHSGSSWMTMLLALMGKQPFTKAPLGQYGKTGYFSQWASSSFLFKTKHNDIQMPFSEAGWFRDARTHYHHVRFPHWCFWPHTWTAPSQALSPQELPRDLWNSRWKSPTYTSVTLAS